LDSGANNNETAELENLTLQQPYQGIDSVTVANGGGLQIANAGSTLIFQFKSFVNIIIVILFLLLQFYPLCDSGFADQGNHPARAE
jgi:hypothetical protein